MHKCKKKYKVARNKSFWRNSNKRVCKYKDAIAPTHLTQPTPTQKYDVSTAREYHVAYKGWISAIHNFLWRSITFFCKCKCVVAPTHPTQPTRPQHEAITKCIGRQINKDSEVNLCTNAGSLTGAATKNMWGPNGTVAFFFGLAHIQWFEWVYGNTSINPINHRIHNL